MDNYKLLVKPGPGEWIPDPSTWGDENKSTWGKEGQQPTLEDTGYPSNLGEESPISAWGENLAKTSGKDDEKMLFDISIDPEERWNSFLVDK